MIITRKAENLIANNFFKKKAILILGARQVGKTTLVKKLMEKSKYHYLWLNGDEADVRAIFKDATSSKLRSLIGKNKIVILDEAQRIENIGICLKLLVDNFSDIQVIATGSSSFELANKINEPLTGRKIEYFLFPFSFGEMVDYHGILEEKRMLENRMIYGYYPDIVTAKEGRIELLKQLADSYLYKDILIWEKIQKSEKLERLVQALAFQIGSEVSYLELGQMTGLDNETTEKYLTLLEKAFIVFRLGSFSRNLRNELKKSRKFYFFDNGIMNAVVNNFNSLQLRNDVGALWENFIISERIKFLHYNRIFANRYFWRTYQQNEIDYLEERDGKLFAFEFKWNSKSKRKFPKLFERTYPESHNEIITRDDFEIFIT